MEKYSDEVTFEKALKRYNTIMTQLGLDHNCINTPFSESTDDWNVRDMVAECDYQLSLYYESDTILFEMKFEDYNQWFSEVNKLKRFINKYEPYTRHLKCKSKHCSKYDK